MITKIVTVYEGSVESLGGYASNIFTLAKCDDSFDKSWSAAINGYEGTFKQGNSFEFPNIPYGQGRGSYRIRLSDGELTFTDTGEVDTGFVYNIVVKKTVLIPDPDYTRSNDILGALKYFYASAADNDELARLRNAHSVLDAIRAHYGNVEGKNIAELLNNMCDEGITPGGGGSSGINFVTFYIPDSNAAEDIRCSHTFDEIVTELESLSQDNMPAIGKMAKPGPLTWIHVGYTEDRDGIYYDELGISFNGPYAFYMESDGTFSHTSIHKTASN